MANENRNQNPGKMTTREAGKKGGEATARTHGREFYEAIGSKGGRARSRNRAAQDNTGGSRGSS
jgi:general stress protein YciG